MSYIWAMAEIFNLDPEKNAQLIQSRGISFEEVIAFLNDKGPLDVIAHPNVKKYPEQKIYVVELKRYIYLIPFVEQKDGRIFLKTIFPSRKARKRYLIQQREVEYEAK